jgi:hypothetical protein
VVLGNLNKLGIRREGGEGGSEEARKRGGRIIQRKNRGRKRGNTGERRRGMRISGDEEKRNEE